MKRRSAAEMRPGEVDIIFLPGTHSAKPYPRPRKWTLRHNNPALLAELWETALHSEDFADLEWVCYIADVDQADGSMERWR